MLRLIIISFFLLLFSYNSLHSQLEETYGEYVDDREGTAYQTIKIGTTLWMTENMKFKTENSENHQYENSGEAIDVYFYPHDEVAQVCPTNFRIASSDDWEAYMQYLYGLKNIPSSSIHSSKGKYKVREYIMALFSNKIVKPFDEPNPLKLKAEGHTQTGQMVAMWSFNIWMKYRDSTDLKYHLHLDEDGYSVHTHKRHITTKKRKLRKFAVRCVKDITLD